jgi:hypothetical protein
MLEVSSSQQQISASLLQVSASYISLSGSYNTFSGSASTRVTKIENNYATTGSNSFRADQSITGSLVVSSTITAQTLVVQTVTSSIVYSSGSNLFGSALGDTQTFTGSMFITGSQTVFGNVATTGNITIQKTAPNILMKGGYAQDLGFFLNSEPAVYLVDDATATKGMKVNISTGAITQLGSGSVSFTGALTGTSAAFTTTSGLGITITTNDIVTLKMNTSSGTTKNWGFATTNLAASDFGIYQSTSNGGDAITAGSAKLYFSATGAATFSSSITATSATFSGSLSVTGASTFISPIEVAARFMTNGDGTIIIGGTAAQGASSGEQYITYQNFTTNTNAWMVGMDDGEDFRWAYGAQGEITNEGTLMKISQAGNVGIGTTTPYVIAAGGPCLDLRGPTWSFIELGTSSTLSGTNDIGYLEFMNGNNTRLATIVGSTDGTAIAGLMRFSTANSSGAFTERMRINSTGSLLINTTTPGSIGDASSVVKLVVNGDQHFSRSGAKIYFGDVTNAAPLSIGEGDQNQGGSDTDNMYIYARNKLVIQGGSGYTMRVGIGMTNPAYFLELASDSAAKPSTNTWTISSDSRVKENIESYTKGLNALMQINPITYDYNGKAGFTKGYGGIGIIAQDVLNILPESISTYHKKLEDTDENETELYNFNSHALTYIMINAIQELKLENDSLKEILQRNNIN